MNVYEIDGDNFSTLDELYDEISRVLIPDAAWNLDAFNDTLHGGFGTPEDCFVPRWRKHDLSRERLGSAMFDVLREIIDGHPAGFPPQGNVAVGLA